MSLTSTATADSRSTLGLGSPSPSRDSTRGQTQLRRRMHALGMPPLRPLNIAVSPPGAGAAKNATPVSLKEEPSPHADDRHLDEFESFAASEGESDPELSEDLHIGASPKLGQPNGTNGSHKRDRDVSRTDTSQIYASQSPDNVSPSSRSWYEFDLSVVVALVSPIGNWLTGGDHVKNLLLILLLVFYLHQIIESMPSRLLPR